MKEKILPSFLAFMMFCSPAVCSPREEVPSLHSAFSDPCNRSAWRLGNEADTQIHHPFPLEKQYIGELQERWILPSDHLPIGISLEEQGSASYIVSWNVLNSAYLNWIYDNSQGLRSSILTKENIPINEEGLTLREQHVIDALLEMIESQEMPKNILCLQECSERFLQALQSQMPENMEMIRSSESPVKNQNIVLYDIALFRFVEKTLHLGVFSSEPARPLMEVVLEKDRIRYRIFNAHLRCDSTQPQSFELARFIQTRKKVEEVLIALGDLNVEQAKMDQCFAKAARECNEPHSFLPFSPYKTTVSPELYSKAIDHIFIDFGGHPLTARASSPNEVLKDLQKSVDLLNGH